MNQKVNRVIRFPSRNLKIINRFEENIFDLLIQVTNMVENIFKDNYKLIKLSLFLTSEKVASESFVYTKKIFGSRESRYLAVEPKIFFLQLFLFSSLKELWHVRLVKKSYFLVILDDFGLFLVICAQKNFGPYYGR